uniref:Ultraviolet sensitive opsin 1 n=1 Tax=Acmaeodera diffusa TaxID=1853719 RepID=A0A193BIT9_9COLE|nr:ultraviolet wavelength sensitive opsin 1 [Acmaeodera diffusa]ANN11813.1 ultraviolet wavelength sensitive opsin 1 [Acmaeodera diffusa]APY20543.1 ultraviolet sensitive opsin 1 [Acmaeodera diffusa]
MLLNWTAIDRPLPQLGGDSGHEVRLLGWNIPPSELVHIPEHWLKYPEPEASLHFLLILLYLICFLLSTVGNGMVIWIFSTAKSLRTPSNMFVVNLAVLDFIMLSKSPLFIYNAFHRGYAAGHLGCQIFGTIGTLSGIGAGMTDVCIAYDRYTTITNPLEGRMSKIKAIIMIIFVWLYTLPWIILPFTEVWNRFVPEGFLTTCSFDYITDTFDTRLFVVTIFVWSYVFPLLLIIYFYTQIVAHVFRHEKALKQQAKKMNVDSLRSNQAQADQSMEIRIAKVAITITFLFVAAWTPYAVVSFIGAFGDRSLLTPGVTMIPACCCKFIACVDPYVYALSHPRYRVELQRRLPWLSIKEHVPSDSASVATESAAPNTGKI